MRDESSEGKERQTANQNHGDSSLPITGQRVETSSNQSGTPEETEPSAEEVHHALELLELYAWTRFTSHVWAVIKSASFWMAIATIAIAVFTWKLTDYSSRQWTVMRGQLTEMQNQLTAFKDSQSAELFVDKFDAKLAPVRTNVFGRIITNPKELEIQVAFTIKNAGPGVAKEIFIMKNGGSFDMRTVPIQYPPWQWGPPTPFIGGRSLGPGDSFVYRPELPTADAEAISPAGGKRAYFTIGINYRDNFGRPQVVTECDYWVATIDNARWTGCDWIPIPKKQ